MPRNKRRIINLHRGGVTLGHKYAKIPCPECGEFVAENWTLRHMRKYHPIKSGVSNVTPRNKGVTRMSESKERAARLGISEEAMEMLAHLTDIQIRTQTCDDCKNVMSVHPGGAWRFKPHHIRCNRCIETLTRRFRSAFDARYVD